MVAVTLMWSTAGVITRHLEFAHSFEVTFWRSFFTLLSLLIILPVWQGRGVWSRLPWRSPYFWLSGLCWACMFTAFMMALTLTAVANVLITLACGPLLTALGAWLFISHRLPLRTWMAIAFAGLGIALIFNSQLQLGDPNFLIGICVALLVFAMVVVGGITRLTESGLSMVEWRPVTGWLPPLSAPSSHPPSYRRVASR